VAGACRLADGAADHNPSSFTDTVRHRPALGVTDGNGHRSTLAIQHAHAYSVADPFGDQRAESDARSDSPHLAAADDQGMDHGNAVGTRSDIGHRFLDATRSSPSRKPAFARSARKTAIGVDTTGNLADRGSRP
jgi:hypothetical protein